MAHPFDPGYTLPPFRSLVESYPGDDVYPRADFRVEWGPVFHRGRLDRSAKVLLIGQDPAANEAVVRRILVGVAGQRVQGFLAKLGLSRSYVLVNAFLYSVYGQQGGNRHRNNLAIAAYRNRWLDALLVNTGVEAVVSFGTLADSAWKRYRQTPAGAALSVAYVALPHPTYPESSSKGNAAKLKANTTAMLTKWNAGLATLRAALSGVDQPTPPVPYADAFAEQDMADIPEFDLPPGLPAFMRQRDGWAKREGATAAAKRATLVVRVPEGAAGPSGVAPLSVRAGPSRLAALSAAAVREAAEHPVMSGPVDPAPQGRLALKGRVVTMDRDRTVIAKGVVYVDGGTIVAVQSQSASAPAGFAEATVVDTGGATIYPGLIELHNHVSYNALRLWDVPRKFTNRNQWASIEEYRKFVTGPMSLIGKNPDLVPALVRYVECKALIGGTTTTQGITLSSNPGIGVYYRGIVRNVEETGEDALPDALTKIADVESKNHAKFLARLKSSSCLLLHLSEGKDDSARKHFLALRNNDGEWAVTPALAGIHAAALRPADFEVMADHGAAIVWSPLSNLLLYGDTADVAAARDAGVRIALGPDWSPSGSKNLLGELKAAKAWSDTQGGLFSDEELVAMATTTAADVLTWGKALGSIEPGKKGDLLVVRTAAGDPYAGLIGATEADVELVVINGVRRFGTTKNMKNAGPNPERLKVGGKERRLNLHNPNTGQLPSLSLAAATKKLKAALSNLPELARAPVQAIRPAAAGANGRRPAPRFVLELDEIEETGAELRPHLPHAAHGFTGPTPVPAAAHVLAAAKPLSELLIPLTLDPLTAVDDKEFLDTLKGQKNPPPAFKTALARLYAPG